MKVDRSNTQELFYMNINGKDIWLPRTYATQQSTSLEITEWLEPTIVENQEDWNEEDEQTQDDFFRAFDWEEEDDDE